jgi:type II secretion system protein I
MMPGAIISPFGAPLSVFGAGLLTPPPNRRRRGFSLVEVILALAILTGAVAVLGEVARHTMRNVTVDRVLTRAEMLCESKMAEIVAGLTAPEPTQDTLADDGQELGEPSWQYSVEVDPVDSQGLVAVRVTVRQGLPAESHPLEFSLVRWMTTPDALANLNNSNNSNNTGNTNNTNNTKSSSPTPASPASPSKGGGS